MIDLRGLTSNGYIQNIRLHCIGRPYGWGKWGPEQYDCSGVVSRALCLRSKMNSQQLFDSFKDKEVPRLQAEPGTLFFYGKDKRHITHVMTVLDHWANGGMTLAGARGGDSKTITIDDAKRDDAFVDVCIGDYWSDNFCVACDPFLQGSV